MSRLCAIVIQDVQTCGSSVLFTLGKVNVKNGTITGVTVQTSGACSAKLTVTSTDGGMTLSSAVGTLDTYGVDKTYTYVAMLEIRLVIY